MSPRVDQKRLVEWMGRVIAAVSMTASVIGAQVPRNVAFIDVGSERERVLRVLQITGDVPLYPLGMRQLAPVEADRLRPLTARGAALLPPTSSIRFVDRALVTVLPADGGVIYNSAFPYGYNDGPIWAGRGLTGAISAGVAARVGPLSVQLQPMFFDAQNASFPLRPTGVANQPYWDAFYPTQIDLPQRFGNRAYHRLDPGQSSIRLDLGPAMAELSTADQWWGPAIENPLILGNNAPGFPHLALGTAHPVNIGIGSVHARAVWGRLDQSAYSPDTLADSLRFMAGFVAEFSPRGVPGLELGATRFFHLQWPQNGILHAPFSHAFEGILKHSLASASNPNGEDPDNQLASLFFRWAFPSARFEMYGEYGREDHNADIRDFWQELDHDAGYMLGFQRAWLASGSRVVALRGELLNTRISHLYQGRSQAPWYTHNLSVEQGHTVDGQLLGAPAGYGGAATNLAVDIYAPSGRWTVEWSRAARATSLADMDVGLRSDILQALSVERRYERGSLETFWGASGIWDLNRDFTRDRFNLNMRTGVRVMF